VFETVTGFETWPDMHLSTDRLRSAMDTIDPFDVSEGARAFYRLYAARFGKARGGDKTTVYCTAMPDVQRVLPEARFIHVIRDGRDVAVSIRPLWFSPGTDIATIALDWRHRVNTARRHAATISHYLEVRYENLVRSPRQELRRICEFVELPYDPVMERYYERVPARLDEHEARRLPDGTMLTKERRLAQQQRTRLPPQRDLIGRWRRELTGPEQAEFVGVAGDLLSELGYERV
jgi:hypothetical protein